MSSVAQSRELITGGVIVSVVEISVGGIEISKYVNGHVIIKK